MNSWLALQETQVVATTVSGGGGGGGWGGATAFHGGGIGGVKKVILPILRGRHATHILYKTPTFSVGSGICRPSETNPHHHFGLFPPSRIP